jgi:hypothetical protein
MYLKKQKKKLDDLKFFELTAGTFHYFIFAFCCENDSQFPSSFSSLSQFRIILTSLVILGRFDGTVAWRKQHFVQRREYKVEILVEKKSVKYKFLKKIRYEILTKSWLTKMKK